MPAPMSHAFCVDEDYDISNAGDRRSRYGSYLYSRAHLFSEDGEPVEPPEFAATAFTIACAPVMSPGYVRQHPRIQKVAWCWDDDYRVAFKIQLAVPLPTPIADHLRGKDWADWHREWSSDYWFEPYDNDRPGAFTVVTVRVPVGVHTLPDNTYTLDGTPTVTAAKTVVRTVCGQLNAHLDGILTALESR
jgi:hypothetical protein